MAVPLYIFFGFGSIFAFDNPSSINTINIIKLIVMDIIVLCTPIAMILGLIFGHKTNSIYYLLTIIFPILLFIACKCFFTDL